MNDLYSLKSHFWMICSHTAFFCRSVALSLIYSKTVLLSTESSPKKPNCAWYGHFWITYVFFLFFFVKDSPNVFSSFIPFLSNICYSIYMSHHLKVIFDINWFAFEKCTEFTKQENSDMRCQLGVDYEVNLVNGKLQKHFQLRMRGRLIERLSWTPSSWPRSLWNIWKLAQLNLEEKLHSST